MDSVQLINVVIFSTSRQKTTISPVTEFVYERRSKMNSTNSPLTLRKSDDKNQVNDKEDQEIFLKHLINHDHKRSNQSKAPETQTRRNIIRNY